MRKFIIFLTITVFFGCLGLGLYTSNLFPEDGQTSASAPTKPPGGQYQRNIAILHVDELQSETPKLISIWGLILYYPEPKIILQPLYPLNLEGNQELGSRFAITKSGDPHPVFMQFLADDNKITWDNYILIDDSGLSTLIGSSIGGTSFENLDPAVSIVDVEDGVYTQLCSSIVANPQHLFDNVLWTQLIPSHFHSNLFLEDILEGWARLTRVEQPLECQVFGL